MYLWGVLPRELKILLGLFVVVVGADAVSIYMIIRQQSNIQVLHIYTLLEYSFLIIVFSYWQKSPSLRRYLLISIPLFALLGISAKIFLEAPTQFDNFTSSVEGAVLVGVSAYTLYGLILEDLGSLYREPRFWVSVAVLVYFSGNLVAFSLRPVIFIGVIHSILNIISNLCYTGGFLSLRRR